MLSLNNLKADSWSRKTSKRLWRGGWSGKWTFSGKGCKGQNARAGGWVAAWFEWGQTPLFRRMPKLKGFSNAEFKKHYNIINLADLEVLASKWISLITKEVLAENGLIDKKNAPVKLLAKGELKAKLDVKVNKASLAWKTAVENAWGKIELI